MHIRAKHAAENLTNLVERELAGEGHDALRRISLMAAEQIRSDRRTEKRFGPRRTILTAAQGLRFFSESPVALPILLFQCHATAKMRGCLSISTIGKAALVILPDVNDKFSLQMCWIFRVWCN